MSIKWQLPIDPHGIDSVFDGSGVATAGPEYGGLEFRSNIGGLAAESYDDQIVARTGVFGDRHFKVSLSGTSVIVAGGHGEIGTSNGAYPVALNGSQTLGLLTVADTNYARIDRVVVRVDDPTNGGADDRCGFIEVIDGAPAAAPSAPAVSGTSVWMEIAQIDVPKNGTGTPSVRDTRKFTAAAGGVIRVNTTAEVATAVPVGGIAYDVQANLYKVRKSSGVVALQEVVDTGWVAMTPDSGFTADTFVYRHKNGVVQVIGVSVNGNLPVGATTVGTQKVPAAYRPKYTVRGACWLTSGNTGNVAVTPQGNIDIAHQSGGSRTASQFSATWLLG